MVRGDLADVALASSVFAPHYAAGMKQTVLAGASIFSAPTATSAKVGTTAKGDAVEVFDISGGWAWVRCASGPGYIPADALSLP